MVDRASGLHDWLNRVWYKKAASGIWLVPFGWLFRVVAALRRLLFRSGFLSSDRLNVPVIVVGNINVGGTGKTPFTVWLVSQLSAGGKKPAVVSRGYGGNPGPGVHEVVQPYDTSRYGDEPVLIAAKTGRPVFVGADRAAAARAAIAGGADIIVADDGLQHYRLRRDVEIALVDAERGHGNGRCLPAGPLREPVRRLEEVDIVVHQDDNGTTDRNEFSFRLHGDELVSLDGQRRESLEQWRGRRVNAVAAIANPGRFFRRLAGAGLDVTEFPLPDHAGRERYAAAASSGDPVVVTEKDAVKLQSWPGADVWCLPVTPRFNSAGGEKILAIIDDLIAARGH